MKQLRIVLSFHSSLSQSHQHRHPILPDTVSGRCPCAAWRVLQTIHQHLCDSWRHQSICSPTVSSQALNGRWALHSRRHRHRCNCCWWLSSWWNCDDCCCPVIHRVISVVVAAADGHVSAFRAATAKGAPVVGAANLWHIWESSGWVWD